MSAVTRAQERIREGKFPLTMLTHHLAGDDSTEIVGQLTKITVDADGAARYEAILADTAPARTIASLVDPNGDGPPFLRGVSIRGGWLGSIRNKMVDGTMVETADDLELDGLDFTKTPGVLGADVDTLTYSDDLPQESDGRALIYETVQEARMQLTEDAPATATRPVAYADPGYRSDKVKRYPLDTAAQSRAAWLAIHTPTHVENYTTAQQSRIRDRAKRALVKHGATIDATEGWVISPAAPLTEAVAEMDCWPCDEPGSFYVSISNGTVNISVSSWRVDPADLELCARAAMDGACQALAALHTPEDDATDETAPALPAVVETKPIAPEPAWDSGTTKDEETGVADQPTTPAADAPQSTPPATPAATPAVPVAQPSVNLSADQFAVLLARLQPQPAPPAEPATTPATGGELVTAGAPAEAAPVAPAPVAETEDQRVARLVAEGIRAALPVAVQEHVAQNGPPQRKGLVTQVAETAAGTAETEYPEGWPTDESGAPLEAHKMTPDQWRKASRPQIEQAVLGSRSVYRTP